MKQELKTAKVELNRVFSVVLLLAVTAIGAAFTLDVLSDVKNDFVANSVEANATQSAIDGVAKIPNKFSLIGSIVVMSIIITLLVRFTSFGR